MSQDGGITGDTSEPKLNVALHIRYWLRCLKTLLPTGYQEQDSSRIVLGFFILTSLDLLGALDQHVTSAERANFITFIYHCQHPGGGFRSFPGTDFGSDRRTAQNGRWDPANVAGTYFALASLVILGDDLSRVNRKETLSWVRHLQLEDGSFGDVASGIDGVVDGGQDVRFCFLAALICVVLGEEPNSKDNIENNVNAESLTQFILDSQVYDGGIARKPDCESHAGSTYCGISALRLLGRLVSPETLPKSMPSNSAQASTEFVDNLVHWLAYRQTTMLCDYREPNATDDGDSDDDELPDAENESQSPEQTKSSFIKLNSTPVLAPSILSFEEFGSTATSPLIAGINGRVNKPADTCYSFWTGATLSILNHSTLLNHTANRRYLLDKTQHKIGGFGKFPGDLPDILHSALALAYLAIHEEPGLKTIDPILCVCSDVKARMEGLPWKKTRTATETG